MMIDHRIGPIHYANDKLARAQRLEVVAAIRSVRMAEAVARSQWAERWAYRRFLWRFRMRRLFFRVAPRLAARMLL